MRVILTPEYTLRSLADVRIDLSDALLDFGGHPLPPFDATFRTASFVLTNDAVGEDFSNLTYADRFTTAFWNRDGSSFLTGSLGLGGNGRDGDFMAGPGFTVIDSDAGPFHYKRMMVPEGATLRFEGDAPARIYVLEDATLEGSLDLRGGNGTPGFPRGDGRIVEGGRPGAGGGRGGNGNPNGLMALSISGETGQSPAAVSGTGPCNIGLDERRGGGCPGARSSTAGGSGGGGGHLSNGGTDNNAFPLSGLGGLLYGDTAITELAGGSGGGGGGNKRNSDDFTIDDLGGAGGGGGGAILLSIAGAARLERAASIRCSGGDGGAGAGAAGAGGGGSGGSIKLQAIAIADIASPITLDCRDGLAGTGSPPGRPGGIGAFGRIRFEDLDGVFDIAGADSRPAASTAALDTSTLGISLARSLYYDAGALDPNWRVFRGSDAMTGDIVGGPDVQIPIPFPAGTSARIVFFGTEALAEDPAAPDIAAEIGPVTDLDALDGLQFVRFEIVIDASSDPFFPIRPRIDGLRLRFSFA